MIISKETLKHLEELAKIEIDEKKQEKMINDLGNILGHFEELREVDTEGIEPMAGGTVEKNVFREDSESSKFKVESLKLKQAFPEKDGDFLKVPAVFE